MKIGIFGKGGSGKTTVSALLSQYLDDVGYRVGLIDVDVNSQTANIIPITGGKPSLSTTESSRDVRSYLAGNNSRIRANEFLNTTPPGRGSGIWRLRDENYLTRRYGQGFGKGSYVFTLGSYKPDDVGIACHHGTQSVAENMISHSMLGEKDCLITDSVAGNDAFGSTLFLHDILLFIVKPEREGIDVLRRFLEMARAARIDDRVFVIANQVQFDSQQSFIAEHVAPERLLGCIGLSQEMIQARLDDQPVTHHLLDADGVSAFENVRAHMESISHDRQYMYDRLIELHKQVAEESWVAGSYRSGLVDQIDREYRP